MAPLSHFVGEGSGERAGARQHDAARVATTSALRRFESPQSFHRLPSPPPLSRKRERGATTRQAFASPDKRPRHRILP
ncbi:hypothetical protein CBM2623_A240044 [Cupriavidus taiwanensis]|nr:hypothetical protein CBM2623_A240044 [Cupriavidus taiwanensis]